MITKIEYKTKQINQKAMKILLKEWEMLLSKINKNKNKKISKFHFLSILKILYFIQKRIPNGENYQKLRKNSVRPFSFHNRENIKKEPIL